jgi:hypothetical protein
VLKQKTLLLVESVGSYISISIQSHKDVPLLGFLQERSVLLNTYSVKIKSHQNIGNMVLIVMFISLRVENVVQELIFL